MRARDIDTVEQLVEALDLARRRAARGTGRGRLTLDDLAARTGIPRSTVHVYLTGRSLPTPDAFDALLQALGVTGVDLREWAEALERVATHRTPPTPRVAPAPPVLPAAAPPVPRQLPPAPRGLEGRDREFARLDEVVAAAAADADPLVVVVSGAGGVGKTALVSAWAARHAAQFPDGQLWIDLHGYGVHAPTGASAALGRLLRALGVDANGLPADVETRAEVFRSHVAERRVLVVLDNARDSAHARPLLPGGAHAVVVVTSRSELRTLVAETGAARLRLAPLERDAGRRILVAGAGDVATGLTDRLVDHAEGLPLALRILAERIAGRSPSDLAAFVDDLDDRHARLAALELDDGDGGFGIRAVLQSSYAALPATAAEVFRALPLCLGRVVRTEDVAACADLTPDVTRRHLDALVTVSLLRPAGRDEYVVDDLVATFAEQARLAAAAGDARGTDHRLADHLVGRYQTASAVLGPTWDAFAPLFPDDADAAPVAAAPAAPGTPSDPAAPLGWSHDSLEIASGVAARALDRGEVDRAWQVAGRLAHLLATRVDLGVLVPVLTRVAERFEHEGRTHAAADAWRALGAVCLPGDLDAAGGAYRASRRCASAAGGAVLVDVADRNVAFIDLVHGWPTRALPVLLDLERRFEERGAPLPAGVATLLPTAHVMVGDLDEAARRAHAAARLAVAEGDTFSGPGVVHDLATVADARGEHDTVVALLIDHQQTGPFPGRVAATLASALISLHRLDEAERVVEQERDQRAGRPGFDDLVLDRAGAALLHARGRSDAAVDGLVRTLRRAERWSLGWDRACTLLDLARIRLDTGDASSAGRAAAAAAQLCRERGYRLRADEADRLLVASGRGHPDPARGQQTPRVVSSS